MIVNTIESCKHDASNSDSEYINDRKHGMYYYVQTIRIFDQWFNQVKVIITDRIESSYQLSDITFNSFV